MITGSILLALVAAVFLVLGLGHGPDLLYYCSIVASVLAALALVAGLRQDPAGRLRDDFDLRPERGPSPLAQPPRVPVPVAVAAQTPPVPRSGVGRPRRRGSIIGIAWVGRRPEPYSPDTAPLRFDDEGDAAVDPMGNDPGLPDEPGEQRLSAVAAARVAQLDRDVVVIDGRPRYHLAGCLHLLGREPQHLPVSTVVELGFTPCAQCEPARALLATSQR